MSFSGSRAWVGVPGFSELELTLAFEVAEPNLSLVLDARVGAWVGLGWGLGQRRLADDVQGWRLVWGCAGEWAS